MSTANRSLMSHEREALDARNSFHLIKVTNEEKKKKKEREEKEKSDVIRSIDFQRRARRLDLYMMANRC